MNKRTKNNQNNLEKLVSKLLDQTFELKRCLIINVHETRSDIQELENKIKIKRSEIDEMETNLLKKKEILNNLTSLKNKYIKKAPKKEMNNQSEPLNDAGAPNGIMSQIREERNESELNSTLTGKKRVRSNVVDNKNNNNSNNKNDN